MGYHGKNVDGGGAGKREVVGRRHFLERVLNMIYFIL